jgi:uncharacterized protein involved in exopolysaccharide biosynthesis
MISSSQIADQQGGAREGYGMSVRDLVSLLWAQKIVVLAATVVAMLAAILAALLMQPVYSAHVTALPVEAEMGEGVLSGLAGELGGLAALAGISTGGGTRRAEAVALLNSQAVIERFIEDKDLRPVLFPDRWDPKARTWTVEPDEVPTVQDAYRVFDRDVRRVVEDPVARTVVLEILWSDREVAAAWANEIVKRVNETMRQRTIEEAQRSVKYLEQQLENTTVVELRQVLFRVMQDQITTMTLANSREEFGLRVVDPAVSPASRDFVRPKRLLIVLGGMLGGLLLGVLAGLVRARVI